MERAVNDKTDNKSDKQVLIFYSYSPKDEVYREELVKHLSMLRRSGYILEWYDRRILPGEEWDKRVRENLENADLILLLLSADFFDSDYIFNTEAARALEKHKNGEAVLVPVLVRPVIWEKSPFDELQVLPFNRQPIAVWNPVDAGYVDVCEGLTKLITAFRSPPAGNENTADFNKPIFDKNRKVSGQRVLDAAFPEQVPVGETVVLVVMIRDENSEGLRKILRVERKYGVGEKDVASGEAFTLDFPVDEMGRPRAVELNIKVTGPDFKISEDKKIIAVAPDGDTGPRIFLLTALKAGLLGVNLEVRLGETVISECFFTTRAVPNLEQTAATNLKSFPINDAAAGNVRPNGGYNAGQSDVQAGDAGRQPFNHKQSSPINDEEDARLEEPAKPGKIEESSPSFSISRFFTGLFSSFLIAGGVAVLVITNQPVSGQFSGSSGDGLIVSLVLVFSGLILAVFSIKRRKLSEKKEKGMNAEETAEQTKMTDWYNPKQLIDTAKKTMISTIIGANADPRLVSPAPADGTFFDYSREFSKDGDFKPDGGERPEIWIDYVSDVGDGWNPTYSVAYSLARETLDVGAEKLARGEILIFGGDGVYPTANAEEYEKKLVVPYRLAFNASRGDRAEGASGSGDLKKNPHVFVLPGNHDWYDSLVAFQKLFCTDIFNRRRFAGGWQTRQERSYFALKLPQKWWLLGVDLQLSHNIDVPQLQYFQSIVGKMQPGDRVILCVPEPYWVKAIKYQKHAEAFEKLKEKEESVEKLESILRERGVETKVYMAGDLHHYRRFESEDGRRIQKITAGGGGAFLHPTHDFDFDRAFAGQAMSEADFTLEKQYPEPDISRRLDWKNVLGFISRNPTFGLITAVLYPLLALLIHGEIKGQFSWRLALKATVNRFIGEPLALLVVVLLILALIFFTDSNSKIYKRTAGAIHGLTHLTAVFFLGWLSYLASQWLSARYGVAGETARNLVWFVSVIVVGGVGGYLAGSFIMGLYLFVSLHFFGRHDNEAFSAMKIEDYKNFVRMHIDAEGDLTIYPIKIEKVARQWDYVENDGRGFYEPLEELKPDLIEDAPVKV